MPAGLSVDKSGNTCKITGTPTQGELYGTYKIRGKNSAGSSDVSIPINITDILELGNLTNKIMRVNESVDWSFSNTYQQVPLEKCHSIPSLPNNLSVTADTVFGQSTCRITGTVADATAATTYNIYAIDRDGYSSRGSVSITIE